MCNRCLYLSENDGDWKALNIGVGIHTGYKKKFARTKSPNWAALRGLDMSGFMKKPDPLLLEPGRDYTQAELEALIGKTFAECTETELVRVTDGLLKAQARTIDEETGKERGIGGEDPILFEEHLYSRRRREILNENGVPEPNLVSGMYNRSHPEGRKVNSEEQRRKHGASYYRN